MALANSIWYNKTYPQPTVSFQDTVANQYLSTIQGLDFSNSSAVNTINSWAAENTNNKIPSILKMLSPGDVMVLVNAIYFNGTWMHSFDATQTKTQPFYPTGGKTVNTPFMSQTQTLRTSFGTGFTLAELPYGAGQGFDMLVALPTDQTIPITQFAQGLDATTLANAYSQLDSTPIELSLPKWEYSYTVENLGSELTKMGMGIAFGSGADFSRMYPGGGVDISKVIHKAYISVSEQGTEAAAVTAVTMTTVCVPCNPGPIPLNLNHPFVYLITEKQTGLILFMGVVNDPSQH
jgi:serpin B